MSKYFAYDAECGFELFETADEAESYAQEFTFNAGDEEDIDKDYADYKLEDI